jgi:hypothetical protein
MVLRLIRDLPGDHAWLPPSVAGLIETGELSACIGAPGPHDFAVRCSIIRPRKKLRLTLPRPSHPLPNVRDDRDTPLLMGRDVGINKAVSTKSRSGIFSRAGMDKFSHATIFLPVGQITPSLTALQGT